MMLKQQCALVVLDRLLSFKKLYNSGNPNLALLALLRSVFLFHSFEIILVDSA